LQSRLAPPSLPPLPDETRTITLSIFEESPIPGERPRLIETKRNDDE
jgi:hypothetical protein